MYRVAPTAIAAGRIGARPPTFRGAPDMLWTIAIILLILWLLGGFVFDIAGGLIHLLLVIAVIVVLYRLITGRRPVA